MIKLNFDMKFNKEKIACFDLDHTLIKPKSGKTFPLDSNDWKWNYDSIPNKINELYKNNYNIIIFTNQLGISKNKVTKEEIVLKIKDIQKKLNLPLMVYISFKDDIFRKPRIGSWKDLIKNYNVEINNSESFYVGDMAGRIETLNNKKDRNDSDRKFAKNIKLKFFTPEMFFLNQKEREWKFNDYLLDYKSTQKNLIIKPLNEKEILLISGYPASGKTTLTYKLLADKFKNYSYYSRDKDKYKLMKLLELSLKKNENVIIEGLLYNQEKREKYINIAKKYNYKIRLIEIQADMNLSYHMNIYRSIKNKDEHLKWVVYFTYRKRYEEPDQKYFYEIIKYYPELEKKVNKYFLY